MAYAELAGLPAITGLYTSILCLLGYAVFGPSQDPRARPGLVARADDRRDDPAAHRRDGDPAARGGAGLDARALRRARSCCWPGVGQARVRRRPAVEADADRLHERPRPDDPRRPAAEAVRILGRRRRASSTSSRVRATGVADGETVAAALAVGIARAGRDPGAAAAAAEGSRRCSSPSCCRSRVGQRRSTSAAGRLASSASLPQGFPPFTSRASARRTSRSLTRRRFRHRARRRSPTRSPRRRRSRHAAARTGRRQPGDGRRSAPPTSRPGSSRASRSAPADRAPPWPSRPGAKTQLTGLVGAAAITADAASPSPGCCGTCRKPTLGAVVIAASLSLADIAGTMRLWKQRRTEFAAVDRRVPRRRAARGAAGDRGRGRAVDPQRLPPGVVAVPDRCSGGCDGLPGYHDVRSYPEAERLPGLRRSSGSTRRCSSPTRARSASRSAQLAAADPRPRWIVVAAEPITDVDTTAADVLQDARRVAQRGRRHAGLRRDEGPGAAQDRAVRADRDHRPRHFFPTLDEAIAAFEAERDGREPSDVEEVPDMTAEPTPAAVPPSDRLRAAISLACLSRAAACDRRDRRAEQRGGRALGARRSRAGDRRRVVRRLATRRSAHGRRASRRSPVSASWSSPWRSPT